MFERPHHQRIAKVLSALNVDLLQECDCYLGGSVPIVLALGEYREVADINFLCASVDDGFRMLRNTVIEQRLGTLLAEPVTRAFVHMASACSDDFESMRIARVVNDHVEKTLDDLRAHHAARVEAWATSRAIPLCGMAPEARTAQGCPARAA